MFFFHYIEPDFELYPQSISTGAGASKVVNIFSELVEDISIEKCS